MNINSLDVKNEIDNVNSIIKSSQIETDSGWKNITLLGKWKTYSGQNKPQYRKIGKIVYLRGLITTEEDITNEDRNIFQLESGFYPTDLVNNLYFTVRRNDSTETTNFQITKTGMLFGPALLEQEWISLDGICFPI